MHLNKTWFEKMDEIGIGECMPLDDTPKASIYSSLWQNKHRLFGRKFRVQKDKETGKEYVCRVR